MFFKRIFFVRFNSDLFHRSSSITPITISSPASYDSTMGSTKMPLTSTPKAGIAKNMTPKLTKMYQDHIDPMAEYELAQSMARPSNSVSNNSRKVLQSLDISTPKLTKMYQDHIDPMTEYELAQSMNRQSTSVPNSSRRALQSLDISTSSGSSLAFQGYENFNRSTTPTSVQSWPIDNFTHQSRRHYYAESVNHFSEFDSFSSTHSIFQNQENENDVEMQSPIIQRLLNDRDDKRFSTFSTFSI